MNTIDKLGIKETFTQLIDGSIEEFIDDEIVIIEKENTLSYLPSLKHVELPNVERIRPPLLTGSPNVEYIDLRSLKSLQGVNTSGIFKDMKKLSYINVDNLDKLYSGMFSGCSSLTSVSLPKTTEIADSAFLNCTNLQSISIPNVTFIRANALKGVPESTLNNINFDNMIQVHNLCGYFAKKIWKLKNVASITSSAFEMSPGSSYITEAVDYHNLLSIDRLGIYRDFANKLKALILRNNVVCTWNAYDTYTYNIPSDSPCKIYVPSDLVDAYKNSEYTWSSHKDRIFPIEGSPFEDPDWDEEVLNTL